MSSLDAQIAAMEERVLNAATLEASAKFHDQLDTLRARRDVQRLPADDCADAYKRGYDSGYHAGQRLAATRTPEPPDSGPRHIGDTDPSGNWDGSDDTGPEPPDSGDGGTRALHEGIEERLTMASDPFSRRESIHAYIDAWLESAGSVADIENLAAEYARLRAACRPCPEGGE